MKAFKAKADKESSSTDVKYSMFVGRWQPLHKGHLWLINERLKEEGTNTGKVLRKVIKPSKEELDLHKNYLKSSLVKNYY